MPLSEFFWSPRKPRVLPPAVPSGLLLALTTRPVFLMESVPTYTLEETEEVVKSKKKGKKNGSKGAGRQSSGGEARDSRGTIVIAEFIYTVQLLIFLWQAERNSKTRDETIFSCYGRCGPTPTHPGETTRLWSRHIPGCANSPFRWVTDLSDWRRDVDRGTSIADGCCPHSPCSSAQ